MPHTTNGNPAVWNIVGGDGFDAIQHFNCPWTINSHSKNITIDITYLKRTLSYDFWIHVETHPQRNPNACQLLDVDELRPLFRSLATALLNYYEFLEPHLNEIQLHSFDDFLDHLSYKVDWTKFMAKTHLPYPDIGLDKFSGTNPDEDAESFV